jgi:5'-3' exonuclease
MGIVRFYSEFLSKVPYPGVLVSVLSNDIEGICIDMNGLIHAVAQRTYCYDKGYNNIRAEKIKNYTKEMLDAEFQIALKEELEKLFKRLRPKQYLCLCVDGVAPRAKILQQRMRRFKPSDSTIIGVQPNYKFNPTCITPGTEFMNNLDLFLNSWLAESRNFLPKYVVYSSHRFNGEGEHKMFRWLRDLLSTNKITQGTGQHIIYGLDADLTMLSILSPVKNIILCRENLRDNVSIDALLRGVQSSLDNSKSLESIGRDFVIMIYLIGNDFLPHLPSLGGVKETIDLMFKVYRMLGHSLHELDKDNNYKIKWDTFTNFLILLAQEENELLLNKARKSYNYPFTTLSNNISKRLNKDRVTYEIISFDFDKFRSDWYNIAFPYSDNLPADIYSMCSNYLKSIAWVFAYYQGLDISKHYAYPYQFGPLLIDLVTTAAENVTDDAYTTYLNYIYANESDYEIGIVHQLLSVIPPKSSYLIDENYAKLIQSWGTLSDLCPIEFPMFYEGVKEKWEGIPILPPANMDRVKMEVDLINPILLPSYYKPADEILSAAGNRIEIPGKYQGNTQRGGYQGNTQRGGYQGNTQRGGYQGNTQRGGYKSNKPYVSNQDLM